MKSCGFISKTAFDSGLPNFRLGFIFLLCTHNKTKFEVRKSRVGSPDLLFEVLVEELDDGVAVLSVADFAFVADILHHDQS